MNKKMFAYVLGFIIIGSLLGGAAVAEAQTRRRSSSGLSTKINNLDDDQVEDLPIPVLFGVALRNLTKNYGDPRAGHSHIGLDIMAPEGTPIVSPTEAVVTGMGVWTGAGNYVQTAAPGGERFVYMHLSEIADIDEGDVLKVGDIVGYVGHTGNAVASAPHLHFELYDEDNDTTDPYPRFTKVFTPEEKMEYLEEILDNHDDEEELAELLVKNFRSEFVSARIQGIDIPDAIIDALGTVPASTSSNTSSGVSSTGTLMVGSRGSEVVALQAYLIKKGVGTGASITADGAFGPMTKKALIEFQASAGLTPDGVYGPKSKAYVVAHP
ncbi:MAG TPA: peptidoglycan DD-metalloendopeptidase family protein [Candidatus Paceibacterota bacterium]